MVENVQCSKTPFDEDVYTIRFIVAAINGFFKDVTRTIPAISGGSAASRFFLLSIKTISFLFRPV